MDPRINKNLENRYMCRFIFDLELISGCNDTDLANFFKYDQESQTYDPFHEKEFEERYRCFKSFIEWKNGDSKPFVSGSWLGKQFALDSYDVAGQHPDYFIVQSIQKHLPAPETPTKFARQQRKKISTLILTLTKEILKMQKNQEKTTAETSAQY